MEIVSMQIFPGRNIYCHRPVIKMIVDLGGYAVKKTNEIEGFNLKLLQLLPGLSTHFCSLGRAGGFVERLQAGTYPGHVMEHMILELQHMAGNRVIYGKTRLHSEPSIYMIIFEISGESCGMECAKAAAAILDALLKGQPVELKPWLDRICRVTEEEGLGPSTQAIFQAAKKAGIPVMRLGEDSLLQLGYGKYSRLVQATLTDAVRSITTDVVSDKQLTKRMLASHDLPVPRGDIVRTLEEAEAAAEEIGYPVVLKPHNGNQGKGVTLNICSREHLKKAWDIAEAFSSKVLVEQYVRGRDYRVLVVGDKVSAAAERTPPGIFGDGKHTIAELVQLENQNVLRGKGHEKPLTRIPLDEVALEELNRQGFDQNSVPAAGRLVRLRGNGNLSTGGTARDCTLEIHPDNAAMAVSAAKIMGLDIAGIDMVSADIAKPLQDNHGVIVEVNAAPGLRMHLHPTEGDPRDVAGDIVRILFPEGRYHTIPIISVTGTNGKTTTTRMIGHILESAGFHVGMTTTGGIYIGGVCKVYGDNTGPASARMVLSDRTVEAAVLETARGGIIQKGLGYDMADVGVIVNISEDHLGLDGIETLEEMADVKSLVVEAVKPGGYAVLNADDKMTPFFLERIRCNIILFSMNKDNPLVLAHIRNGGIAVLRRGRSLYLQNGNKTIRLLKTAEIPAAIGGILECNIENALAATAAMYALGVPPNILRRALHTFNADEVQNPGRFNLYDMGGFRVLLDYGHNPAGYRAAVQFIRQLGAARRIGILGMPGDRLDRQIRETGAICAGEFSRYIIKEDRIKRGRQPGEVAALLRDALMERGIDLNDVILIENELEALKYAVRHAVPGDLIVMFHEDFKPAAEWIHNYQNKTWTACEKPCIISE